MTQRRDYSIVDIFNPTKNHDADATHPAQPLLEPAKDPQKPPLAGPEVDDLGDGNMPHDTSAPYPGIDDGLLEPEGKAETNPKGDGDSGEREGSHHSTKDDGVGTEDGKWFSTDEPDYPYDGVNGFGYRFGVDDRPGSPMAPGSIPDVNTYQQKKNLAQGMMDLALLSANANQLRYVIESASSHRYYYPSLTFIGLSIVLQIAVGVGLIMNSRYNVKDDKDICKADKINNFTVLGVFLITIVNVFITSFSVATPEGVPLPQQNG
ncbi:ninjurin-A-like isoform X2 [Leptidea sinapis]|uniref:ninjurin-A-like isoform X2 n=1 Tax=Leptidea sinapis TaxID=189913 RepID=UPI0021345832|nr:ninjurin-A-like isoform X2 [Leptidea sinapis]